jgi:hypothetical protein
MCPWTGAVVLKNVRCDGFWSAPWQTVGPGVISPPPSWADADDPPEHSRERRLIGEANLVRNVS